MLTFVGCQIIWMTPRTGDFAKANWLIFLFDKLLLTGVTNFKRSAWFLLPAVSLITKSKTYYEIIFWILILATESWDKNRFQPYKGECSNVLTPYTFKENSYIIHTFCGMIFFYWISHFFQTWFCIEVMKTFLF